MEAVSKSDNDKANEEKEAHNSSSSALPLNLTQTVGPKATRKAEKGDRDGGQKGAPNEGPFAVGQLRRRCSSRQKEEETVTLCLGLKPDP